MFAYNPQPKPQHEQRLIQITCPCGKTFEVRKCEYRGGKRKFCSVSCRYKFVIPPKRAPKVLKQVTCDHCGTTFDREKMHWNRGYAKQYCSNKCQRAAKAKPVESTCLQCGTTFISKPSEHARFCNRTCWREYIKDHPQSKFVLGVDNTGAKNGQYKHGKYAGRGRAGGDAAKQKVREQVILRDGGRYCLFCGKPGPGLHLHRVMYGSQGGRYELGNCVQLCNVHHALVHSNKKEWQPLLLGYLNNTANGRKWLSEFRKRLLEESK